MPSGGRRTLLLIVGGLALLFVLSLPAAFGDSANRAEDAPGLSIHAPDAFGARALALWLSDLGYQVVSIERRAFAIDPAIDVFFLLSPFDDLSDAEADVVQTWVEDGGTLILVGRDVQPLYRRWGLADERRSETVEMAVPAQPVLGNPVVREVRVATRARLRLREPRWVPLLRPADGSGDPLGAVATIGRGRAYVLVDEFAFSNEGIGQADNWALVSNLLAEAPVGGVVAFDEYHHGLTEHGTFLARLVREPWGWATLYAAGLTAVCLVLRGRRFGRAVPPRLARARRTRGEYVSTLATRLRQGGHTGWLGREYAAQVKRSLGARFGIPADRPAGDFAVALAARRPAAAGLIEPLERLEQARRPDEAGLIRLVRSVERVRAALAAEGMER